jgi:hypothetical protein
MKLHTVWFWESLENLPLLLGFVLAARLWQANVLIGLAVLVLGMGTGVLITRLVEPKLHKEYRAVRWGSVIANFLLFVTLAIPFLYYFRAESAWANWKTDILGGFLAGFLLTWIQSLHWQGMMTRMLLHGGAMIVAFPLIMLGLRSVINIDNWGLLIASTILLTLFASLVIALIDYQEMYRI